MPCRCAPPQREGTISGGPMQAPSAARPSSGALMHRGMRLHMSPTPAAGHPRTYFHSSPPSPVAAPIGFASLASDGHRPA